MTERPYELLARFKADGTIGGVSVRTITTLNGRDYENDPSPLSDATDPAFTEFAAAFSAAVVAERDQLQVDKQSLESQLAAMTSERDALQTEVDTKAQRIIELEGQLEALLHPVADPRHVAPFDFLELFKPGELLTLLTSTDPTIIIGRAKLQTIITFVDLDHVETVGLVRYMESQGMIEAGRGDQILAGEPWQ